MLWLVTRYAKDMAPGGGVLVCISGVKAGIYAIVELIEYPQDVKISPGIDYWIDASRATNKTYVKIRFTCKLIDKPLLQEDLKQDPVMKNLIKLVR